MKERKKEATKERKKEATKERKEGSNKRTEKGSKERKKKTMKERKKGRVNIFTLFPHRIQSLNLNQYCRLGVNLNKNSFLCHY